MQALHEVDSDGTGEIVGSYRRGAPTSGDIDFIICTKVKLSVFVDHLSQLGYLAEILALGKNKCMAICSLGTPRRLDILLASETEYPYSLLYFTGSQAFNIAMRQHALDMNYTLNEHGLTSLLNGVPPMKEEKDIFAFLGLIYVPPENRVDHRQICLI
jgi:DNA polymerase/3'-5' exonuclease PolX